MSDNPKKLDDKQKHLLRLIAKGGGDNGWATVSAAVLPLLKIIPSQFIETIGYEFGGKVRLTDAGKNIVLAMEWL